MIPNNEIQRKGTQISIDLNPGKDAPRYTPYDKPLTVEKFVITEKGTALDLPLIDIVLKDEGGKTHYAMITGRLMLGLADAIKGVNLRNHGKENP